jgi:hypothetical protein
LPDTGLFFVWEEGEAAVVPGATPNPGTSWDGTHTLYIQGRFPGTALCSVSAASQDLASSPLAGTPTTTNFSTCSVGTTDCEFSFDLALTGWTEDAGSDCAYYGIDPTTLTEQVVSWGNISSYTLYYATGAPAFTTDFMVYWYDGSGYTGWYANLDSLYSSIYTYASPAGTVLPATDFDGTDFTYVNFIGNYYYYF